MIRKNKIIKKKTKTKKWSVLNGNTYMYLRKIRNKIHMEVSH